MDADDWDKIANLVEHWEGSKGALAATLKRKAERLRTETAQEQPTPTDSNVNETGADAG